MNTAILIIGITAASIVFATVLIAGIRLILKSNGAYKIGVGKAVNNRAVTELIGEPVKTAFLMTGGVRGGSVALRATLRGSRGTGKLFIRAHRTGGAGYEFETLKFYCGEKVVNLLSGREIENRRSSETIFLSAAPNKL